MKIYTFVFTHSHSVVRIRGTAVSQNGNWTLVRDEITKEEYRINTDMLDYWSVVEIKEHND